VGIDLVFIYADGKWRYVYEFRISLQDLEGGIFTAQRLLSQILFYF